MKSGSRAAQAGRPPNWKPSSRKPLNEVGQKGPSFARSAAGELCNSVVKAAEQVADEVAEELREDSAQFSPVEFDSFWAEVPVLLAGHVRDFVTMHRKPAISIVTSRGSLHLGLDLAAMCDQKVARLTYELELFAKEITRERRLRHVERNADDARFMQMALDQARQCTSEGRDDPPPKVGAVAVHNGKVLGKAFRGELNPGEHAEFTLLEGKLRDEPLAGATLYVTLEPCSIRKDANKRPCAERLVQRRVARVVVGSLDPNREILGMGLLALQEAGIEIALAGKTEMDAAVELNREFIEFHRKMTSPSP